MEALEQTLDTVMNILERAANSSDVCVSSSALLKKTERTPEEMAEMEEHAALSVLHRWGEMNEFLNEAVPLVPEHVEIRSLQNSLSPGLPQVTTCNNRSHNRVFCRR